MDKLSKSVLGKFANEYEMVCAAHDGDADAWMGLFNHYIRLMMSRLFNVKGYTREELQSEAAYVLGDIIEKFDKTKIAEAEKFSLAVSVYRRSVNKTNALIRLRKRETHLYCENVNASHSGGGQYTEFYADDDEEAFEIGSRMIGINDDIYYTYNPERLLFESLKESDSKRVKKLYARISEFERRILECRRAGKTLAQTAEILCTSVTTVKSHINKIKKIASEIFEVDYR